MFPSLNMFSLMFLDLVTSWALFIPHNSPC